MATNPCPPCLEDLNLGSNCGGSASGVKKVLYALHEDVKTWPTKKPFATRTSLADHINTTAGNIIMQPGTRFYALASKKESAELKFTGEGNAGGRSFKESLEVYHPGFRDTLLGFGAATQNKEMVFLVLAKTGDWYLLGDEDEGVVHETFDATSGKAAADDNGAQMIFSRTGVNAPTIYKGDMVGLTVASEASGG